MDHGGERDPVRYAQLGEHVPEVGVHGVRRDVQPPGHGAVRQSLGHQQGHCPLGSGEALPAARRPVPGSARGRTQAEGPQLRPDPACPGIGAGHLNGDVWVNQRQGQAHQVRARQWWWWWWW